VSSAPVTAPRRESVRRPETPNGLAETDFPEMLPLGHGWVVASRRRCVGCRPEPPVVPVHESVYFNDASTLFDAVGNASRPDLIERIDDLIASLV